MTKLPKSLHDSQGEGPHLVDISWREDGFEAVNHSASKAALKS